MGGREGAQQVGAGLVFRFFQVAAAGVSLRQLGSPHPSAEYPHPGVGSPCVRIVIGRDCG